MACYPSLRLSGTIMCMSNPVSLDDPVISPAERARRRHAVRQATASIRLEGGTVDAADLILDEQYIAGQITLNQYMASHLPCPTASGRIR
jgi:Antitoxin VbhA